MKERKEQKAGEAQERPEGRSEVVSRDSWYLDTSNDIITREFSWKQEGDKKQLKEWHFDVLSHLSETQQVTTSTTICHQRS